MRSRQTAVFAHAVPPPLLRGGSRDVMLRLYVLAVNAALCLSGSSPRARSQPSPIRMSVRLTRAHVHGCLLCSRCYRDARHATDRPSRRRADPVLVARCGHSPQCARMQRDERPGDCGRAPLQRTTHHRRPLPHVEGPQRAPLSGARTLSLLVSAKALLGPCTRARRRRRPCSRSRTSLSRRVCTRSPSCTSSGTRGPYRGRQSRPFPSGT